MDQTTMDQTTWANLERQVERMLCPEKKWEQEIHQARANFEKRLHAALFEQATCKAQLEETKISVLKTGYVEPNYINKRIVADIPCNEAMQLAKWKKAWQKMVASDDYLERISCRRYKLVLEWRADIAYIVCQRRSWLSRKFCSYPDD